MVDGSARARSPIEKDCMAVFISSLKIMIPPTLQSENLFSTVKFVLFVFSVATTESVASTLAYRMTLWVFLH